MVLRSAALNTIYIVRCSSAETTSVHTYVTISVIMYYLKDWLCTLSATLSVLPSPLSPRPEEWMVMMMMMIMMMSTFTAHDSSDLNAQGAEGASVGGGGGGVRESEFSGV